MRGGEELKFALLAVQELNLKAAARGRDVLKSEAGEALSCRLPASGPERRRYFEAMGEFAASALAGSVIDLEHWNP